MASISSTIQKKQKSVVLSLVVLITLYSLDVYAQPATQRVISIWHIDENDACNISDEFGINNGKLKPDCPSNSPKLARGRKGHALEFDGIDDYCNNNLVLLFILTLNPIILYSSNNHTFKG